MALQLNSSKSQMWTCDFQNMPYTAMVDDSDYAIKQAQVIIETCNF